MAVFPIPAETQDMWESFRRMLLGIPYPNTETGIGKINQIMNEAVMPERIQDAFIGGIVGLTPTNILTPEIQSAQKNMAKSFGTTPELLEYKGSTDTGHWFTIKDKKHSQFNSTEIWPLNE